MEKRLDSALAQLTAAIADFERSLLIDISVLEDTVADAVRNGQAQKFEFTVELFWKTVKVMLLERHGFDVGSPKNVVKKYFELGYIGYPQCERFLHALDIRNSLSHIYSKDGFLALFKEIADFGGFFSLAASRMQSETST